MNSIPPRETVARERITDNTTINAAYVKEGELILNIGPFAFHLSPDTARRIQHELTGARLDHDMKHLIAETGDFL